MTGLRNIRLLWSDNILLDNVLIQGSYNYIHENKLKGLINIFLSYLLHVRSSSSLLKSSRASSLDSVVCILFLGTPVCTIIDDFFGKVPKGGGVISDPKNFVAKFLALETPIWGGHFRSKKFRRKKSQNFPPQKKGGRGGQRTVWNFSKNSLIMVQTGVPKRIINLSIFHVIFSYPCQWTISYLLKRHEHGAWSECFERDSLYRRNKINIMFLQILLYCS